MVQVASLAREAAGAASGLVARGSAAEASVVEGQAAGDLAGWGLAAKGVTVNWMMARAGAIQG